MPAPNPAALDFLLTRRSRPAKTLTTPVPDRDTLVTLLTAAARTPDHGKLEPWRFIVLEKAALTRLAERIAPLAETLGIDPDKVEKAKRQYADADLAIAVVFSPKDSAKVPPFRTALLRGRRLPVAVERGLGSGLGRELALGLGLA